MSRLQVSEDQQHLILRGEDADRAEGAFPRAVRSGKKLLIPWSLENSIRLTAMDLPAVSPIVRDYDFGAYRISDMPHQVRMADFLVRNRRGYIFGETGTGKTLGSLWGLDYLIRLGEVKRVLVLCPLSIVNETWGDTLKTHFPHLSYSVIVGTKDKRQRLLKSKHQFHILNFDGVFSLQEDLAANDYDFVLIDESTAVKTVTTRRWKSINKVVPATARLILQTGTPIPQGPMDAYGQAKLMGNRKIPHTVARFRDEMMYRVTEFKWVPRSDSMEKVKKILTPALYVAKRDVLKDLPPVTYTYRHVEMSKAQKTLFEELRKRQQAEVEGTTITAVNAAVKMAKLLQCIAAGTETLTRRGWIPIEEVTPIDQVWDGDCWVGCGGSIAKGVLPVVECFGVSMTPDHKVLTRSGWAEAQEVLGSDANGQFDRAEVRLPDGDPTSRTEQPQEHFVADALRLRKGSDPHRVQLEEPEQVSAEVLRLPPGGANRPVPGDTRGEWASVVQSVGEDATAVRAPHAQGLGKLRRSGHHGLQAVAEVRELSGGHGTDVPGGVGAGPQEQQPRIQPVELPVGVAQDQCTQPEDQCLHPHPEGEAVRGGGSPTIRPEANHTLQEAGGWVACTQGADPTETAEVFDVLNAGPQKRFTVRGADGVPLIVHNCAGGAVYNDDGDVIACDAKARITEMLDLIEQSLSKTIVFVPYRHVLEQIGLALKKHGVGYREIHGDVKRSDREEVFREFQKEGTFDVLLAIPNAMAHGVTATAASTIVWFMPTSRNEIYTQACARIDRKGQTLPMTICHLVAHPIEKQLYQAQQETIDYERKVLALYNRLLKGGLKDE